MAESKQPGAVSTKLNLVHGLRDGKVALEYVHTHSPQIACQAKSHTKESESLRFTHWEGTRPGPGPQKGQKARKNACGSENCCRG